MPYRKKEPKKATRGSDANLKLYGRTAKDLVANGTLPLHDDVDLAVENKLAKGLDEVDAIRSTADELTDIWRMTAKIQVSAQTSITRKIVKLRDLRKKRLMELTIDPRNNKKRFTNARGHRTKRNNNKQTLDDIRLTLFDISSCTAKIPHCDKVFYDDQRGPRVLKNKIVAPVASPPVASSSSGPSGDVESDSEDEAMETLERDNKDPDFVAPVSHQSRSRVRGSRKNIDPILLAVAERRGLSVRATADVHNLHNKNSKVSASTIFSARKEARVSAVQDFSGFQVECISIDERQDLTSRGSGVTEKEEHCSVVLYPGAVSAGHYIPSGGTGKELAEGLIQFCSDRNIALDNLVAISTDGCNKMVGWFSGCHTVLENILGRPLQRLLCFFHHLEKSFEGSFRFNGFESTSANSLTEPWRSLISGDLHNRPIVDFVVIENPSLLVLLESRDKSVKLSNDHQIILGLAEAVITGKTESKFLSRRIGPINLARFTTIEARILRCYLSTVDPEEHLLEMMRFLIFVWLPVYVQAKCQQSRGFCGPRLLLLEVQLAKEHLSFEHFQAVKERIDFNGEFAHWENVLLGMLCSESRRDRSIAVNVISEIRSKPASARASDSQRLFARKDWMVNEYARSLSELSSIPLFDASTEPPVTRHLSDVELEDLIDSPLECNLPLTTVATERAVKETTRISKIGASGPRERDGIMALSNIARKTFR